MNAKFDNPISVASAGEPLHFAADSAGFFKEMLHDVADRCLAFKGRPPVHRAAGGEFHLDIEEILSNSNITDNGEPLNDVIDQFDRSILQQSVNFGSPTFLAHPDNGAAIGAVIGDFARAMMHQNMVSYEYSPAATYAEYSLLTQIRKLIGYESGIAADSDKSSQPGFFDSYIFGRRAGEEPPDIEVGNAGGAFVFGGTGANFACLLAARESLRHKIQKSGSIYEPRKVAILTKTPFAHYSLRRAYSLLGIGNSDLSAEQQRDLGLALDPRINVDSINFKIDVVDLERKIESALAAGRQIMCVFALAGDSRMMSFDDLRAVTKIAERYDIWVHADACEGGQCLFSPNTRSKLLDGVENVNSISIDPHKTLLLPYALSAFFLRDIQAMNFIDANTSLIRLGGASLGTYTPNIGSKDFASLRLWFMLKHWGWKNLANEIDRRHTLAMSAGELISSKTDLKLINPSIEHNAVAFVYCPELFFEKGGSLEELNMKNKEIHHKLNSESDYYIHMMMSKDDNDVLQHGKADITILRMMFGNPASTVEMISACIEKVREIGKNIFSDFGTHS